MSRKLKDKYSESRRKFMARFLTGAGGLAVFGVSKSVGANSMNEKRSPEVQPQTGYHETDHIRTYYKKAGF